jgi:hypothetical protein
MNAARDWMARQSRLSPRVYLSDDEVLPTTSGARHLHASITWRDASVPSWQTRATDRLLDLLQLKNNWDSYGAKAPSLTAAVSLFNVLTSVVSRSTPAPSIVPSPHGHFQAEWHTNGVDLEIEVLTPTNVLVSYSDANGLQWERHFDLDFTDLVSAVDTLEQR